MNSTTTIAHTGRYFFVGNHAAHVGVAQIVEARRCTVQLPNGFLYLDACATAATALLGHDRPIPERTDRSRVVQTLSGLHPDYLCASIGTSVPAMTNLAQQIAAAKAGQEANIHIVNVAAGEPDLAGGAVIAVEDETIGRSGEWLASPYWRKPPALILLGSTIAAGKPFAALLMRRTAFDAVGPVDTGAGMPAETLALVQRVIGTVKQQRLVELGRELMKYFRERLMRAADTCEKISDIHFGMLSARVYFRGTTVTQVKRDLCERGVLVGGDDVGGMIISPPLATRPAEIDVISGALRGACLGLPTTRIAACCPGCESETP